MPVRPKLADIQVESRRLILIGHRRNDICFRIQLGVRYKMPNGGIMCNLLIWKEAYLRTSQIFLLYIFFLFIKFLSSSYYKIDSSFAFHLLVAKLAQRCCFKSNHAMQWRDFSRRSHIDGLNRSGYRREFEWSASTGRKRGTEKFKVCRPIKFII